MTIDCTFAIKNYKSYKKRGAGFNEIKPINVIIGKNNIGKSSLIDAIDSLCNSPQTNYEVLNKVEITTTLLEEDLRRRFHENHTGGTLPGNHWRHHGAKFVGKKITWRAETTKTNKPTVVSCTEEASSAELDLISQTITPSHNNLGNFHHRKLLADRDILNEANSSPPSLSEKGVGATATIHAYLNHSHLDRSLIQDELLSALNEIFRPDLYFSEIATKYHQSENLWEIYLAEKDGNLIALSKSGSGLKTIILVLLNLILRPAFEQQKISQYVFSFEELENNLHPALQRSLFLYLERFAVKNNCHMFLTTHSNIAIDVFANSPNAQINHIQRDSEEAYGTLFNQTSDGYNILHDLGVKASDILQSNGLIWVEGPSDRVFINKFIEIWSSGELREGAHYQFIFYGGSILANLDAELPRDEFDEAVKVFRINKNLIFVCDSDKRSTETPLKDRVVNLKTQLEEANAYCWITECKEIENYIPKEAFEAVHEAEKLKPIKYFEPIKDYLKRNNLSNAAEYREKHSKAAMYSEYFTKENLSFRPELNTVMNQICEQIRRWNQL